MNYCTLDEIKAELDITSEDKDDLLQADIAQASKFIDLLCDRDFTMSTATRYFDGGGTFLFIDDAVSISKVELDEDADGVVDATMSTTTDYILYPLNKTPKTRIEISNNSNYSGFASGVKQGVKITASWGYGSTIPEVIKRATIIQVCRWFKRRESAFQDAVGSPEIGQLITYKALDPDVKLILDQYRRRRYP